MHVEAFSHQQKDMIAARVESDLVQSGRLAIEWLFPYGSTKHTCAGYDFNSPGKHSSTIKQLSGNSALIFRKLDNDSYCTYIQWADNWAFEKEENHRFCLKPLGDKKQLEFCCLFFLNR